MRASILRTLVLSGPCRRRLVVALGGAMPTLALGGCGVTTPATDATLGQTVIEMTDAVNALRDETSMMQAQIDSLRTVVARQDSAIARLSGLAGVPLPPP